MNSMGGCSSECSEVPERLCRCPRAQGTGRRGHGVRGRGFRRCRGCGHDAYLYPVCLHACVHVRVCVHLQVYIYRHAHVFA